MDIERLAREALAEDRTETARVFASIGYIPVGTVVECELEPWAIAARTREPVLAREVLRLRAWLLDITDAIPGGWPSGTEPPA